MSPIMGKNPIETAEKRISELVDKKLIGEGDDTWDIFKPMEKEIVANALVSQIVEEKLEEQKDLDNGLEQDEFREWADLLEDDIAGKIEDISEDDPLTVFDALNREITIPAGPQAEHVQLSVGTNTEFTVNEDESITINAMDIARKLQTFEQVFHHKMPYAGFKEHADRFSHEKDDLRYCMLLTILDKNIPEHKSCALDNFLKRIIGVEEPVYVPDEAFDVFCAEIDYQTALCTTTRFIDQKSNPDTYESEELSQPAVFRESCFCPLCRGDMGEVEDKMEICPKCGLDMREKLDLYYCGKCNASLPKGVEKCHSCGEVLELPEDEQIEKAHKALIKELKGEIKKRENKIKKLPTRKEQDKEKKKLRKLKDETIKIMNMKTEDIKKAREIVQDIINSEEFQEACARDALDSLKGNYLYGPEENMATQLRKMDEVYDTMHKKSKGIIKNSPSVRQ